MKASLEEKLILEYPDGFHELDEDERKSLTFLEEGPCLCLSDPAKHILISIGWKHLNGFVSMMLNTSEIAGDMAKKIEAGMQSFDYRRLGSVSRTIAGHKAEGIDYEYKAEGTDMFGESLALKLEKDLYYFNLYTRQEFTADSMKGFEDILGTAAFKRNARSVKDEG